MPEEIYHIDVADLEHQFLEHLDLEQNERIIFSSRFGNGKTTFLKNFFKNHTEFNSIYLSPVNYSVAGNEDIFELIKYDILFELLSTKIELQDGTDSLLPIAKKYLVDNKEDLIKILTPFLSAIPFLGKGLQESSERIIEMIKDLNSHLKNKSKGEYGIITDYLFDFTSRTGNIYEENFYTKLLKNLIDRLRNIDSEGGENKQTVLVIDDFDRIDPEHVFRILNVFAAHQDTTEEGNKFGFDKVIIVCDIDNIRNVFHHKYGANTDFNGYIDKFFSVDVFTFSMVPKLNEELNSILRTIKGNTTLNEFFDLPGAGTVSFDVMSKLLHLFVQQGLINVRNIIKLRNNKFNLPKYIITTEHSYYNVQFWGLCIFNFMKIIFGDYEELLSVFEKFKNTQLNISIEWDKEWILKFLLLPIHCADNRRRTISIPIMGLSTGNNINIRLLQFNYNGTNRNTVEINSNSQNAWESSILNCDLNEMFYRTYKIAFEKGYLQ